MKILCAIPTMCHIVGISIHIVGITHAMLIPTMWQFFSLGNKIEKHSISRNILFESQNWGWSVMRTDFAANSHGQNDVGKDWLRKNYICECKFISQEISHSTMFKKEWKKYYVCEKFLSAVNSDTRKICSKWELYSNLCQKQWGNVRYIA